MPRAGRISIRHRLGPGRYQTVSYTPWEYRRLIAAEQRAERRAQEAARLAAMTPEQRQAERAARYRSQLRALCWCVGLFGLFVLMGFIGASFQPKDASSVSPGSPIAHREQPRGRPVMKRRRRRVGHSSAAGTGAAFSAQSQAISTGNNVNVCAPLDCSGSGDISGQTAGTRTYCEESMDGSRSGGTDPSARYDCKPHSDDAAEAPGVPARVSTPATPAQAEYKVYFCTLAHHILPFSRKTLRDCAESMRQDGTGVALFQTLHECDMKLRELVNNPSGDPHELGNMFEVKLRGRWRYAQCRQNDGTMPSNADVRSADK